jgi:DnaJ-domain-containing protein 1
MHLPGRLSRTTLGDLLGRLHRSHASGALELRARGRRHRIHLERGAVIAVDLEVDDASDDARDDLDRLFALLDETDAGEATIRFHVGVGARAPRRSPVPIDTREILYGRRRARDRDVDPNGEITTQLFSSARERACRLLGVPADADHATVRRAFRNAASRVHPDRFAALPDVERTRLQSALAELTAAYHLLVA